jgi:hypothetical protein
MNPGKRPPPKHPGAANIEREKKRKPKKRSRTERKRFDA